MYTIGRLQAGYVRHFSAWNSWQPGIGASLSASILPADLESVYGGRVRTGVGLFLTLRPAPMDMMGMDMMNASANDRSRQIP